MMMTGSGKFNLRNGKVQESASVCLEMPAWPSSQPLSGFSDPWPFAGKLR
jgi:hypothetical protein